MGTPRYRGKTKPTRERWVHFPAGRSQQRLCGSTEERYAHPAHSLASNRTTRAGRNQNASLIVISHSRELRRLNMRRKHVLLLAGVAVLTLIFSRSTLAEYRTEKNLKLEPGGRFIIDSSAGSVTIT